MRTYSREHSFPSRTNVNTSNSNSIINLFSSSILYVDDTTIFVYGQSLRFLKQKMQSDLNSFSDWLVVNGLKLNVSKTKVMVFECQGLSPYIHLEIDQQAIENVTTFKFLGLNVCADLTFKHHYEIIRKKLLQSVFILRQLSQFLPLTCLRTLYYAYFHLHLTYCLIVCYPMLGRVNRDNLYKLQKRAIRIINGALPLQHCMPLFKSEGIVMINDQIFIENCKLIHRVVNKTAPLLLVNSLNGIGGRVKQDQTAFLYNRIKAQY